MNVFTSRSLLFSFNFYLETSENGNFEATNKKLKVKHDDQKMNPTKQKMKI